MFHVRSHDRSQWLVLRLPDLRRHHRLQLKLDLGAVPIGRVRRDEGCYRRLTLASLATGGP